MSGLPKDWAVRSDYRTDDDFIAAMREIASSDLPDAEKLELLVRKLDVTRLEDEKRNDPPPWDDFSDADELVAAG